MKDGKEESLRLHRARRALERKKLDEALAAADLKLQACRTEVIEALLQVARRRLQEAVTRLGSAVLAVDEARTELRTYFDGIGGNDDRD